VHNGLVFVAGQIPIDPKDRNRPVGSIEEQTERTLRNVEAILVAAGAGSIGCCR
jgi:enamine deaminase RidA (YjgF/YER057c/UK114 family)